MLLLGCLPESREDYLLIYNREENSVGFQFYNKCPDFIIHKINDRNVSSCEEVVAELSADGELFLKESENGSSRRVVTESIVCSPAQLNPKNLFCKVVLGVTQISDLVESGSLVQLIAKREIFELEGAAGPITSDVKTPFLSLASAILEDGSEADSVDAAPEPEFIPFDGGGSKALEEDVPPMPPSGTSTGGGACSVSPTGGNIKNLWPLLLIAVWMRGLKRRERF